MWSAGNLIAGLERLPGRASDILLTILRLLLNGLFNINFPKSLVEEGSLLFLFQLLVVSGQHVSLPVLSHHLLLLLVLRILLLLVLHIFLLLFLRILLLLVLHISLRQLLLLRTHVVTNEVLLKVKGRLWLKAFFPVGVRSVVRCARNLVSSL